jgi:hypothetical protein
MCDPATTIPQAAREEERWLGGVSVQIQGDEFPIDQEVMSISCKR